MACIQRRNTSRACPGGPILPITPVLAGLAMPCWEAARRGGFPAGEHVSGGLWCRGEGGDFAVTEPGWAPSDPRAAEEESYRIVRSRIDLSRLPRFSRDVTERVIQASADFDYFTDLVCDEDSLAAGVAALAAGAPVIADCAMVAAGITDYPVISKIAEPLTARLARTAA